MSVVSFVRAVLVRSAVVVVLASSVADADTVIFVSTEASQGGDGTSWATAYRELQDGLAAADSGDQIWVAAGVYAPDRGTRDREASFQLQSGVTLYGGFVGDETALNQRDPGTNETILSGDLNGDDADDFDTYVSCCVAHLDSGCSDSECETVVCTAQPACCDSEEDWTPSCAGLAVELCTDACSISSRIDNSYHVVTSHDVDDSTVLDGFTITGGHADGPNFGPSPDSRDQGSGLNNYFGTPQVLNSTFRNNWSSNYGALNDNGGATLINCTFKENYSETIGAGLYIHDEDIAPVTVSACTFANNITTGQGGAVFNNGNPNATFTDCAFTDNRATIRGGAMYNNTGSRPTLTRCIFDGNEATVAREGGGGGMFSAPDSSLTLRGCTFLGNKTGSSGAGMHNSGSSAVLTDCTFSRNRSVSAGGGIFDVSDATTMKRCLFLDNQSGEGGGLFTFLGPGAILTDCTFAGNSAVKGGGMASAFTDPKLTNCTFTKNTALPPGNLAPGLIVYEGGGLRTTNSNAILTNCLFSGNLSDSGGGYMDDAGSPTLVNCLFSGNMALGFPFDNFGGAMRVTRSLPTLINCTFSGNRAFRSGGLYLGENPGALPSHGRIHNCIFFGNTDLSGSAEEAQIGGLDDLSRADINHTTVEGWTGSLDLEGTGNIGADPLFVRPPDDGGDGWGDDPATDDVDEGANDDFGDLRLWLGSPAIDAGDNEALPVETTSDFDGNLRILAGVVDMGAHEAPSFASSEGSRHIGVTPRLDLDEEIVLVVTSPEFPCLQRYVDASGLLVDNPVAMLPDEWGTVYVRGLEIAPETSYQIEAERNDGTLAASSVLTTARWGDTVGPFVVDRWMQQDGSVDIVTDVIGCLEGFSNRPSAPPREWCDLEPELPDGVINILDIVYILDAFRGLPYPFAGPCD